MKSTILVLLLDLTTVSNASTVPSAISGSQCQAKNEGALSSKKLIRSTFGITNKSDKIITVYCPAYTNLVNTNININYHVSESNVEQAIDLYAPTNLDCYLAYNIHDDGRRKYKKFIRGRLVGGEDVAETSVFLKKNIALSDDPLVIKCNLRPGDQVRSINTRNY